MAYVYCPIAPGDRAGFWAGEYEDCLLSTAYLGSEIVCLSKKF